MSSVRLNSVSMRSPIRGKSRSSDSSDSLVASWKRRESLKTLFDITTPLGRRVESIIGILIVASLVTVVAETVVDQESSVFWWLEKVEFVIWVLFVIEYALRVSTAPVKRRYIFSFYGMVDLLAVLSALTRISALGALKALRILRALRVLKLVRYSSALDRFSEAYRDIKDELAVYFAATGVMTFIAAYGIWELEHENNAAYNNIFDCVYWAVASITTLGADMVPTTIPGRILSMLLVLLGLGLVAVPSGLLASALSKQDPAGSASRE